MPYTLKDLESVERALKSGVLSTTIDGNSVTYRSVADLIRVRDMIRAELGLTAGENGRTHRYAEHSKGL